MKSNLELMQNVVKPYIDAKNQALTNQVNGNWATGGKNLLPIDLASLKSANTAGTWSGNAYTVNNTTLTLNDDKSISVTTGSGGASATFVFWLIVIPTDDYSDSNYILSGCPEGGGNNKYALRIYKSGNTYVDDTGSGANVVGSTGLQIGIVIFSAQSLSNKVFKSMLRFATDSDPTYQPYAKTNVELTQDVADVLPIVDDAIEITTTESFANLKNGITYKFSVTDTGSPFEGYNVAVKVAKVASTSGIQMAFKVVSSANTNLDLLAIRPCLSGTYGPWRMFSGVIPT